jgi:hypothetical protein
VNALLPVAEYGDLTVVYLGCRKLKDNSAKKQHYCFTLWEMEGIKLKEKWNESCK